MKHVVLFLALLFPFLQTSAQQNCDPESRNVAESSPFKLFQNFPNPVKDRSNTYTYIKVQVNCPGLYSLKMYDMVGNIVYSTVDEFDQVGSYQVPIETAELPDGVYFYMLKKDRHTQTMKMVVARGQ